MIRPRAWLGAGAFVVAMACVSPVSAQSFNCRAAGTTVEDMICANRELSMLDEQMAAAFRNTRTKIDPAIIDQVDWLRDVRNECDNVACIRRAYQTRTDYLRALATLSGFTLDGVAGDWSRVGETESNWTSVRFENVTAIGFVFEVGAMLNDRVGMISGEGIARAGVGLGRDEFGPCRVAFGRRGARLIVLASPECIDNGGLGIIFEGEFEKRSAR